MDEYGVKKTVYLLNENGKVSENLMEKVIEIVPITDSYRKAETVLKETTNSILSFEWIRKLTLKVGDKITAKEKEERKLLKKKQEEKCKKENKKFNLKGKIKTEIKLHVMYEGWKKDDKRYRLINKQYIAGMMKQKEIRKLRDPRVYQEYKEEAIKIRGTNEYGAKWTKGTTVKGGTYQKDEFHIMQEIVRDVSKEYRKSIQDLVKRKEYEKIEGEIERLKYEVGGECKAIEKLEKLQGYLSISRQSKSSQSLKRNRI